MKSPHSPPKDPDKVVGWSLVLIGVMIGIVVFILSMFVGRSITGAIGGGIIGLIGFIFFATISKIITRGRRRMAT